MCDCRFQMWVGLAGGYKTVDVSRASCLVRAKVAVQGLGWTGWQCKTVTGWAG